MAAEAVKVDLLDLIRRFTSFLEAARRCLSIVYLYHGEGRIVVGRVYVYRGLVEYGGRHYESGEYLNASGPVRAVEESILVVDECAGRESAAVATDCALGDIISRQPVTAPADMRTIDAIRLMWESGVSSVVVVEKGRPVGIFTDSDVKKVVANGVDLTLPIGEVATRSLIVSEKGERCIDALVKMAVNNIKHLVVVDAAGNLVGVVTTRDVAYRLLPLPIHYLKDLRKLWAISDLKRVREEVEFWARRRGLEIFEPGAPSPVHLTRLVTEINDLLMKKVAEAVLAELGPPPCPFAIAVSGSQGVYEQFVVTDMDNYLVASCEDEYFAKAGKAIVEKLLAAGFPPCREGYTMDRLVIHPSKVGKAVEEAGDKDVIMALLLFDGRAVYGDKSIVDAVRARACEWGRYNKHRMLSSALRYKPPLGAFDRLEKRFKPKEQALASLTLPIKALSLIHCVKGYSTLERLRELAQIGAVPSDMLEELEAAYEVLLRLSIWAKAMGKGEVAAEEVPNQSLVKTALLHVKKLHNYLERIPP